MIHSLQTNQIRVSFPEVDLSMKVEIPKSFLPNKRTSKWLQWICWKAISAESSSWRKESLNHFTQACIFSLYRVLTMWSAWSLTLFQSHLENWAFSVLFIFGCWHSYLWKFFWGIYTNELNVKLLNMAGDLHMFTSLHFTKIMNSTGKILSYREMWFYVKNRF